MGFCVSVKVVILAINNCSNLEYLNLEGNTLGVEAATCIAKALEKHPELKRALWKDMFTGRMKTEIPKALVSSFTIVFCLVQTSLYTLSILVF